MRPPDDAKQILCPANMCRRSRVGAIDLSRKAGMQSCPVLHAGLPASRRRWFAAGPLRGCPNLLRPVGRLSEQAETGIGGRRLHGLARPVERVFGGVGRGLGRRPYHLPLRRGRRPTGIPDRLNRRCGDRLRNAVARLVRQRDSRVATRRGIGVCRRPRDGLRVPGQQPSGRGWSRRG